MHLSTHFELSEFVFSQTAARHGIDNAPPPEAIERLEELCQSVLEPVRAHFGPIRISSGYRCLELNRRIGSSDGSQHVRGEAADIQAGARPLAVCRWIEASDLPFHQLIHEFGGWTHVSIAPRGQQPRLQVLTIDRLGKRDGLHEAR